MLAAIVQTHTHCEAVEVSLDRIMRLRATDMWHPRSNPRGKSGRAGQRGEKEKFVDTHWVREVCAAPIRPLLSNGIYMTAKNLSWDQRMVHACPSAGYPLCYMRRQERVMKGPCLEADSEAEAKTSLGPRVCLDCVAKLDILSVARLFQAGFDVQMIWR